MQRRLRRLLAALFCATAATALLVRMLLCFFLNVLLQVASPIRKATPSAKQCVRCAAACVTRGSMQCAEGWHMPFAGHSSCVRCAPNRWSVAGASSCDLCQSPFIQFGGRHVILAMSDSNRLQATASHRHVLCQTRCKSTTALQHRPISRDRSQVLLEAKFSS